VSALNARAQGSIAGFSETPPRLIVPPTVADTDLDARMATLDAMLAETNVRQWDADPSNALWTFGDRLQSSDLTPAQRARVLEHLAALEARRPDAKAAIDRERHLLTALTAGQVAPDIVGKDLDGQDLRLSDFRGTVVVLAFSGEWCGACRAEYPYQRLLLEVYKNQPLTLLSVNSDRDVELAKKAKAARGLNFRSFWDGGGEQSTHGPIASAWGVVGWPTTYIIDADGIIRFVNLRQEDLLKGVKQVMTEPSTKPAASKPQHAGTR
jgi:peroxiredoxin